MATLLPEGKQSFTDTQGKPLVGGKVYTYDAGTSSPRPTYADSAGAVPNTNPVVLDARGEASIFWKGAYKVVLKDSAENVIWSIDGVATTDPSNTTSDMIGYDGGTVQTVLDGAKPMANYTALRNYTGRATGVRITQTGLAGFFQRDDADTTSADNGGTIIVDASGRRWKRLVSGSVNIKWFGALDGAADSTNAIQAALNASNDVFTPDGTFNFTTLTVRQNTRLHGSSTRTSILKHTGAGAAITCTHTGSTEPDGNAVYIESGWFIFEDFTLLANGTFGFRVGNTRSSFSQWNRIYMRHRQDGGTYTAGSVAIDCDNTPWSASEAAYLSKIHHTFIRGFETAVNLQDVVNGWEINRLYTIECLKQVVLSNATGINILNNYFESGLAGATGITFLSGGGNQINVIGTTFELTNVAATQYAYSFAGGTWSNINVVGAKYLIQGDGNAVNSRRITGIAPLSFVELGRTYTNTTLSQDLPMLWAPGAASNKPFQQPNYSRFGGVPGGNGRVILARGGSDASDGWIENDGAYGLDFVSPGTESLADFAWKNAAGNTYLTFKSYTTPAFSPGADNQYALGGAAARWTTVYAATGTINTSDEREKQQVRELSDAERAVAVRLKSMIRAFKFNDAVEEKGDAARIHFGVIAQEVKAAFEAEGLVAEDYAILCFDEWDELPEIRDNDGKIVREHRPAGNRYGVRYEELLAFIIAAL